MSDDKVRVGFGATDEGLDTYVNALREKLESITGPVQGLTQAFGGLGEALLAAFAVERLEKFVETMAALGESALKMSAVLGTSVGTFSAFSQTLAGLGVSSEESGHTLERLERNMAAAQQGTGPAAAAFRALGISIAQVKAGQQDVPGFLDLLRQKWQEYRDDGNKTAAYMALLGRGFDQLIPFFRKTDDELAEMKARMAETGSALTGPMADGMERTGENLHVMGGAFTGIGITLFEAFKPAIDTVINGITSFVESCNNALRGTSVLHDALTGVVIAVDIVIGAIATLSAGIQQAWQVVAINVESMVEAFDTLGRVITDVFTGQWDKIGFDVDQGMVKIETIIKTREDSILAAGQQWKKTIDGLFSNIGGGGVDTSGGGGGGGSGQKPGAAAIGGQSGPSQLQVWRDQLDQQLIAERNFFKDSKAEELVFWQDKLSMTAAGSKEQLEVRRNIYTLEKSLAVEAKASSDAISREDADADLQIGKIRLQGKRDELDAEVSAGKISAQKKIAILEDLAQQEYRLDLQSLQNEISTLQAGTAAYEKVYDQIRVLKEKHVTEMAALDRQEAANTKKAAEQSANAFEHAFVDPAMRAFDGMITGIFQGTQTWQQAVGRALGNMLISELQTDAKFLANRVLVNAGVIASDQKTSQGGILAWILGETTKTAATETGNAARTTSNVAAATAAGAADSAATKGSVGKHAASAAAAVYDDVAQIPYVGWILAPIAAGAAFAGVMAYDTLIPSFDVGAWNLPSDMIAQVHQGESIIPANMASSMREFFAGGANGGGANQAPMTIQFQVSAMDGPSVQAFFNKNAAQLANSISRYMGNNPSQRGSY